MELPSKTQILISGSCRLEGGCLPTLCGRQSCRCRRHRHRRRRRQRRRQRRRRRQRHLDFLV